MLLQFILWWLRGKQKDLCGVRQSHSTYLYKFQRISRKFSWKIHRCKNGRLKFRLRDYKLRSRMYQNNVAVGLWMLPVFLSFFTRKRFFSTSFCCTIAWCPEQKGPTGTIIRPIEDNGRIYKFFCLFVCFKFFFFFPKREKILLKADSQQDYKETTAKHSFILSLPSVSVFVFLN